MKELTIEQKAQRYDEVIERANSLLSGNQLGNAWIYKLLPELKESDESKDERIRKTLIHIVKGACNKYGIKYQGTEIGEEKLLAWLEKKGNKDEEILILKDQIESLHSAIKAIKETYRIELEKQGKLNTDNSIWHKVEPKEYVLEKTLICKENGEIDLVEDTILSVTGAKYALPVSSLGMPKSFEKQGKNDIGISEATKQKLEDNLNKALEKETPESWNEFLEKQGEQKHIEDKDAERASADYRNFRMSCGINDPVMLDEIEEAYYEGAISRKSAEWSEEDETRLTNIIIMLKEGASHYFIKDDITKAVDWLKSIRPQKQWEPSDRQIEALTMAIHGWCDDRECLVSLLEQIKQLKSE